MVGNIDSGQGTKAFAIEQLTRSGEDFVLGGA
jgi:hypothetical protein